MLAVPRHWQNINEETSIAEPLSDPAAQSLVILHNRTRIPTPYIGVIRPYLKLKLSGFISVMLQNIARSIEQREELNVADPLDLREIVFTIISISLSLIAVLIPIQLMGWTVGRNSANSR